MKKPHSPLPKKAKKVEVKMGFPEAIREIIDGKKVTRKEWNDERVYGVLNGDILSITKKDGSYFQWIVSIGDLEASDWIIIN